jgi:hypothetical protein
MQTIIGFDPGGINDALCLQLKLAAEIQDVMEVA